MRAVVVHGGLLVVALALAWTTWSRDEGIEPEEASVRVWDARAEDVDSLVYSGGDRRLIVARRSEDGEDYLWGVEVRWPPALPETTATDTVPPDTGDTTAGDTPPPDTMPADTMPPDIAAPETVPPEPPVTAAFPVGEAGEDLLRRVAPLRALRDLGVVEDDERLETYGLGEPEDTLAIFLGGGDYERLLVGAPVFGSTHRYALAPENSRVYAIPGSLMLVIEGGRGRLQEQRLHAFEMAAVDRVVLATPGSERVRVRSGGTPGAPTTWASPDAPDRPDATFGNFMSRVANLRAVEYHPELSADTLQLMGRLEYLDEDGGPMGRLELFRSGTSASGDEESTAYYVRTERTRVPARANASAALRVAEDLEQLFGGPGESDPGAFREGVGAVAPLRFDRTADVRLAADRAHGA